MSFLLLLIVPFRSYKIYLCFTEDKYNLPWYSKSVHSPARSANNVYLCQKCETMCFQWTFKICFAWETCKYTDIIFLIRYSFASTTLSTNTAESGRPNPSSTGTDLQKMTIAWQINNLRMIIYSLMLYIVAIIRSCSLLGVVLGLVPAGHDPKQRVSSPAPGGPISCSV